MQRRQFLQTIAGASAATQIQAQTKPNIVVILVDDMGFSDIGCYGGEIRTPNIDALAKGGVRFTQFYNTARCCPTRASLLTGLYPHQTGVGHMVDNPKPLPGYTGDLNRNCVTIAQALKTAGYRTMMSGKWHVTPVTSSKHNWPLQRGFDKYYGIIHGAANFFHPVTLTRDNSPAEIGTELLLHGRYRRERRLLHRKRGRREGAVFPLHRVHRSALAAARETRRHRALPRPLQSGMGRTPRGAPAAAE